jgi:hypothetical protein
MSKIKTALFKNFTNVPQIFLDVPTSEGTVVERIRVLPGSKVELPVEFGRKHRKVLTETKADVSTADAK